MWNKIKRLFMISVITGCMLLSGCRSNEKDRAQTSKIADMSSEMEMENHEDAEVESTSAEVTPKLQVENVNVQIPGLENEYKFIFMSDLHIIVENEEISEENLETVRGRYNSYVTQDGYPASEMWNYMPALIDEYDADAILLGGDMIDYASSTNVECLKNGVNQFKPEVLYVRADHDYAAWYNNLESTYINDLHSEIDSNSEVILKEYDDLYIVGINNNTAQISADALGQLKEIFAIGKPIILLTHVPINSLVDGSLSEKSKGVWQDRNLTWGAGCYYEPDENTKQFLDMIYAEDTPVVEILSGHLHFSWDGNVTEKVHQHVFSPLINGYIGVITVEG